MPSNLIRDVIVFRCWKTLEEMSQISKALSSVESPDIFKRGLYFLCILHFMEELHSYPRENLN